MPRRNLRASSPNYYVTTTANNRIKVWKLETLSHTKSEIGKLFTELYEPNYLKIHYTSMALFDDTQNNALLALGDKVGRIVLFSITKSCKVLEISQHTKDASKDFKHVEGGHHSRINCIKFDKIDSEHIHIVTCANDKKLCEWDLNGTLLHTLTVGEDNPSSLTITHPFLSKKKKNYKYFMVAANNINVWNVHCDQRKCVGSFQGHASQTRRLLLSEDNQYLVSSGADRFVYIWKCKSFYKKKHESKGLRAPIYSLPMDDDVRCIDIRSVTRTLNESEMNYLKQKNIKNNSKKKDKSVGETKEIYLICAASKTMVRIWCFDPIAMQMNSDENNGNLNACVEMTLAANDQSKEGSHAPLSWIQYTQFMNDSAVMVLRGTQSIPVRKQVTFVSEDSDSFIKAIVLESVRATFAAINGHQSIDLSSAALEEEKHHCIDKHLNVLHVSDASRANPKSYDCYDLQPNKRRKLNGHGHTSLDLDTSNINSTKKSESESVTFQDKLYEIERKTEEAKNRLGLERIPNADSLYTLLTQSLSANDQSMFDRLLTMQNDEVMREFEGGLIRNTLDRISDEMALLLLEKLTHKFRVSPRQSVSIMRWLMPLLNSHSATFAKTLKSRKFLVSVNQAIDYQCKSLLPAMKLQGRLSLLTTQMGKVQKFREKNNSVSVGLGMARNKPLFVHDETAEMSQDKADVKDLLRGSDDAMDEDGFIEI